MSTGSGDAPALHGRHNDRQRAHFDLSTLDNPRMVPSRGAYVERHLDRVVEAAGLVPGQRILDVGCGLGKFSLLLAERGFDVSGLDLSTDLLDALRTNLDGRPMGLHHGDILDPPVGLHGGFDAVVGFFMLHHLADVAAGFRGVRRCLRPGGVACFLEPNAYSPLFPVQITLTPKMSWRSDKGVFRMRRAALVDAMSTAGFGSIRHRWTGLFPPAIANRGGARLEDGLDRFHLLGPMSSFQVLTGSVT
jgi:2-polyprenyl-3-methyl-5-hydroxy-6-metoxy-1,4-benzoquinol methylase